MNEKIISLDTAVQNLIDVHPVQPIVFTPKPGYEAGRIYTGAHQLREWPFSAPEYRMITSAFDKLPGVPVMLQTVPGLNLVVAGLIENGELQVFGMSDMPGSQEAVDMVMEWFLAQVKALVTQEESTNG